MLGSNIKKKIKVKFVLEEATKAQGMGVTALLIL
jgi:hypothetical protein